MTFQQILDKYRKISHSQRDKGDRFERLMQVYLQTDPKYAYIIKKVWLWNEFPGKSDLGGHDTGIDLVALTHTGDYWAVQCKCYQSDSYIDKAQVDTFLATSGRKFKGEDLKTTTFSHRLWISTTNNWSLNASEAISNQNPPVSRVNLYELMCAPVDWGKLEKGISGEHSRAPKKEIRPHQRTAIDQTHDYFQTAERGKLIMACGTGKTFTALRIAENETDGKGLILFLVPSIALLGQSLREWTADASEPVKAICICSDPEVSKKKSKNDETDTFSVIDLALPASTDVSNITAQITQLRSSAKPGLTVIFSTYQSLEVVAKAQKQLLKTDKNALFDLIICDEAHRTTGVALTAQDSSSFIKVHDNTFIKARKRLYMTATPRLYSDDAKGKAAQADAILCSMDDPAIYGEEIYRIGFGEAVERDLLTDYKVLILTLSDKDVPPAVQKIIADRDNEINSDDATKLIGCINALSKQILGDAGVIKNSDSEPMKRAVAFCRTISESKKITSTFCTATDAYLGSLPQSKKEQMVSANSRHIDGTMSAPQRDELLGWLKGDAADSSECRILTNVRCLSEGVDVPSLDAVMFLSARNSQVDVVQSVGRVMRKAQGKKYGYIIIPVVVPADVEADKALNDNERYKVVWSVLNALRAHDDRFNATVNKIELNRKRPEQILVGRPEYSFEDGAPVVAEPNAKYGDDIGTQLALQFEQLQSIVFARMVEKVGDRRYWEQWAKSVAEIAEKQFDRINRLIKEDGEHKKAFDEFLNGLKKNINPSISDREAVEMLSQHVITKPVFEALFEGYSFVKNNAVSVTMQKMLDLLEAQAIEKDTRVLDKFYESVRKRAAGIDNAEGKQRIIIELYDKFFRTAFPKMVDKLGIVYTPVEVVDFIIHSVEDVLRREFDRSLSDENIHILDPFTGTGTFITRLLQSGLINDKDLPRKYKKEIHANEIVLLAYYIAAVNIENAFHDILGKQGRYKPFDGICLTDTFQLGETDESESFISEMFPQNTKRVSYQKKAPLRVIMGNPPYSVGQKSANDNAQNQKYKHLDSRIAETYAAGTKATNKNSLYDSYIKAFRWGADRLDPKNGGIICFVSNSAWLDGNAQDGFRKCLEREFSSIYVFNLRGNQRTSGELSRKEGGKIFGSGSRTPIAITLLVKKPSKAVKNAVIYYHDIGDYLSREEKLAIVRKFGSVGNDGMAWKRLEPSDKGDWICERNDLFDTFIPLGDKANKSASTFFLPLYSNGLKTQRDAWCYNSSKTCLKRNIERTLEYYNEQRKLFAHSIKNVDKIDIKDILQFDPKKISWTHALSENIMKDIKHDIVNGQFVQSLYRPFFKQRVYFSRALNERVYQIPKLFPKSTLNNLVICVSGVGVTKDFSTIISDTLPDLELIGKSQCFPLYYYEERQEVESPSLFDEPTAGGYIRRDGVSDFILERAYSIYGKKVTKEDIFYYVYGLLHSPQYRTTFANDLKKSLPRIPLVDEPRDFWKFSKAGRELADLHINYETVPAHKGLKVTGAESGHFTVEKMRFPKKGQKDTIIYNSKITIENIPAKAYDYIVNGKSAIEWIMDRYKVTIHKGSGIKNDPNDWAKEVGNERYILDLLLSVVEVSVRSVEVVEGLPKLRLG
ncbi:DEAD/DEAH box helicase family protein [Chitinispirillales bacterium ANBcel5]|uniref:DEAD/DEAH box helicase n=1 Tax=Cellulosispirillum alkaliphilum TaxID=3039283 RepID=UPI002A56A530|nr:DEAD/DEAH box helicase family protein [Chitinispirillales bacterium ANBcel5]